MNKMSKEDYRRCITKMINEIGNEDMPRKLFYITQVYYTGVGAMLKKKERDTVDDIIDILKELDERRMHLVYVYTSAIAGKTKIHYMSGSEVHTHE